MNKHEQVCEGVSNVHDNGHDLSSSAIMVILSLSQAELDDACSSMCLSPRMLMPRPEYIGVDHGGGGGGGGNLGKDKVRGRSGDVPSSQSGILTYVPEIILQHLSV